MKNDFVIKEDYIKHFEKIIKDINKFGYSNKCPIWFNSLIDRGLINNDCDVCKSYFKRLDMDGKTSAFGILFPNDYQATHNCPCDRYSKHYLIRFLRRVITNSIKGD